MVKKSIIGLVVVAVLGGSYFYYQDYQKKEHLRLLKERDDSIKQMIIEEQIRRIQYAKDEEARKIREAEEEVARQARIASGNPIIENIVTYYPETEKKEAEFTLLEGKLEGIKKTWYSNGQLKSETHYKNGLKDGDASEWSETGVKYQETQYKNDQKDGLETRWDSKGIKSSEKYYSNGAQHGLSLHYYNGDIKEKAFYQNGKLEGEYQSWHSSGRKEREAFYKNDQPEGAFNAWYNNGEPEKIYQYVNGMLEGDNYSWDGDEGRFAGKDGTQRSKYHEVYKQNHLLKVSSTYSTGEPRSLEEYIPEEDRLKITQWYKDGTVSVEGYRRQLNPRGTRFEFTDYMKFYTQSGQLFLEIHYDSQGWKNGTCTRWKVGNTTYPEGIVEYDSTQTKGWRFNKKVVRGSEYDCQLKDEEIKRIYGTRFGSQFIPSTRL